MLCLAFGSQHSVFCLGHLILLHSVPSRHTQTCTRQRCELRARLCYIRAFWTHARVRAHTKTHTHPHENTHTLTHTHTHTHSHTHTNKCVINDLLPAGATPPARCCSVTFRLCGGRSQVAASGLRVCGFGSLGLDVIGFGSGF